MSSKKATNEWGLKDFDKYVSKIKAKPFYRDGKAEDVTENKIKKLINHYFSEKPDTDKLNMNSFESFIKSKYHYSFSDKTLKEKDEIAVYTDPYKKNTKKEIKRFIKVKKPKKTDKPLPKIKHKNIWD